MEVARRFNGSSTTMDVLNDVDLTGKIYLITGSSNGLGFETARSMASRGAEIIVCGSSEKSCKAAKDRILKENGKAKLNDLAINLKSLENVNEAATQVKAKYKKLDGLILNAGIVGTGYEETDDGFESVFQVNHLSHFYLVLLLEPLLQAGSRIVILSSENHRYSTLSKSNMTIDRLSPKSSFLYFSVWAYSDSKLCNILHGLELSRRLESKGVIVMSCHPGNMVHTGIVDKSCFYKFIFILVSPFTKSVEQGAATTVYCATAPELKDCRGWYFNHCYVEKTTAKGRNEDMAKLLWDLSMAALKSRGVAIPTSANLN